ncbi:heme biosynthesis protein HemY [Candidatus Mesenet endosymbiont of Agriotes lineatus]|uniref:HesB/IscA family protein n=1 Tax=Candidatus Mesenet endosymbiont of Agriotes lineatus TaxID=3077948 RepID=UPI0030CF95C4
MSMNYNITLTESAIRKVHSLINEEGSSNSALRVLVSGGGCSGFQYNFKMDEVQNDDASDDDDDYDIEDDDFDYDDEEDELDASGIMINDECGKPILLVDSNSAQLLKNSVVDYTEDLNGSGFIIKNPLAKSRCGCGNSFAV